MTDRITGQYNKILNVLNILEGITGPECVFMVVILPIWKKKKKIINVNKWNRLTDWKAANSVCTVSVSCVWEYQTKAFCCQLFCRFSPVHPSCFLQSQICLHSDIKKKKKTSWRHIQSSPALWKSGLQKWAVAWAQDWPMHQKGFLQE